MLSLAARDQIYHAFEKKLTFAAQAIATEWKAVLDRELLAAVKAQVKAAEAAAKEGEGSVEQTLTVARIKLNDDFKGTFAQLRAILAEAELQKEWGPKADASMDK